MPAAKAEPVLLSGMLWTRVELGFPNTASFMYSCFARYVLYELRPGWSMSMARAAP